MRVRVSGFRPRERVFTQSSRIVQVVSRTEFLHDRNEQIRTLPDTQIAHEQKPCRPFPVIRETLFGWSKELGIDPVENAPRRLNPVCASYHFCSVIAHRDYGIGCTKTLRFVPLDHPAVVYALHPAQVGASTGSNTHRCSTTTRRVPRRRKAKPFQLLVKTMSVPGGAATRDSSCGSSSNRRWKGRGTTSTPCRVNAPTRDSLHVSVPLPPLIYGIQIFITTGSAPPC